MSPRTRTRNSCLACLSRASLVPLSHRSAAKHSSLALPGQRCNSLLQLAHAPVRVPAKGSAGSANLLEVLVFSGRLRLSIAYAEFIIRGDPFQHKPGKPLHHSTHTASVGRPQAAVERSTRDDGRPRGSACC